MAVVVLVSVAVSALVLWVGLLWAQHSLLLHAVLPAAAIARLRSHVGQLGTLEGVADKDGGDAAGV